MESGPAGGASSPQARNGRRLDVACRRVEDVVETLPSPRFRHHESSARGDGPRARCGHCGGDRRDGWCTSPATRPRWRATFAGWARAGSWSRRRRSTSFPRRPMSRPSRCWSAHEVLRHAGRHGKSRSSVDGELVTVDGRPQRSPPVGHPGTPLRHVMIDGRPLPACRWSGMGRGAGSVTVWGERREASVLDERARHIRSLVRQSEPQVQGGVDHAPRCRDWCSGCRWRSATAVAAGQGVLVLEAMKMENEIKAAAPGVVTGILVQAGVRPWRRGSRCCRWDRLPGLDPSSDCEVSSESVLIWLVTRTSKSAWT